LQLGGYTEDGLQLMVHLADPISGGRRQSIQERCGRSHILASPGKSRMWRTFVVDGSGDGSGLSSGLGSV
jgi:hypothetical protein